MVEAAVMLGEAWKNRNSPVKLSAFSETKKKISEKGFVKGRQIDILTATELSLDPKKIVSFAFISRNILKIKLAGRK